MCSFENHGMNASKSSKHLRMPWGIAQTAEARKMAAQLVLRLPIQPKREPTLPARHSYGESRNFVDDETVRAGKRVFLATEPR